MLWKRKKTEGKTKEGEKGIMYQAVDLTYLILLSIWRLNESKRKGEKAEREKAPEQEET